jgi:hypothetical protein
MTTESQCFLSTWFGCSLGTTYIKELHEAHFSFVHDNSGLQSNELAKVRSAVAQLPNKALDYRNIANAIARLSGRLWRFA